MKKSFLLATLLASTSFLSQAELVRLIVKPAEVSQASIDNNSCVSAPNGKGKWCLSAPQVTEQRLSPRFNVVQVESYGYSAEEVAKLINATGRFGLVEADIVVRTPNTRQEIAYSAISTVKESDLPQDPRISSQSEYYGSKEAHPTGMNLFEFWEENPTPDNPITVAVLDSSFYESAEITYAQGVSTTTFPYGEVDENDNAILQERTDDFFPRGPHVDFCTGHGVGVASTLAGNHNNDFLGAGAVRNATVHPIRVMDCGAGYLSDSAAAIDWLNGLPVEGDISPYEGERGGIINLSLSAPGDVCPSFLQDSINTARANGWTIFVSAGNDDFTDAAERTPANCEGVVTVGALDRHGDIALFTNVGEAVSVTARGERLLAACGDDHNDEGVCLWQGTSFSSPLVAGVMAEVSQATGVTGDDLAVVTRLGVSDVQGAGCEVPGSCGTGIVNAQLAMEIAQKLQAGELNTISYALSEKDICEQQWYIDNLGGEARLCSLYQVNFLGGIGISGFTYELLSVAKGGDLSDEASLTSLGVFSSAQILLEDIDAEANDYGVRICKSNICEDIVTMNTDSLSNIPIACN